MSRSATELALLDEKIARIRKQNEEIIKRKQIIAQEIEAAKRNNAIVNTKNAYKDEDSDKPSLYSDSVTKHQQKIERNRSVGLGDSRGKNDRDEAWRREREKIDKERIRRQKAASGWKREWDANKTFENENDQYYENNKPKTNSKFEGRHAYEKADEDKEEVTRNTDYRLNVKRSSKKDDDDFWGDEKRDVSYRTQFQKASENNGENDWNSKRNITQKSQERKFYDSNRHPHPETASLETKVIAQNQSKNKETLDHLPTSSNVPQSFSFNKQPIVRKPLIMNKVSRTTKGITSTTILNKVTNFSEIRAIPTPMARSCMPWTNDFSNRGETRDLNGLDLSKIVIHVKTDGGNIGERKIEIIDEPSTKEKVSFNRVCNVCPEMEKVNCASSESIPSRNSVQQQIFTKSTNDDLNSIAPDEKKTSLQMTANNDKIDPLISAEVHGKSSPNGILKKSPPTIKKEYKTKKSVSINEEEVIKNDDDEEWENVSDDDEWEDVSD